MSNFLEFLGSDLETTTIANVRVGSIADKVVTVGKVKLGVKNTSKLETIAYDFAFSNKKGKKLFTVSESFRAAHSEILEEKTGFNQFYAPGDNKLFVAICTEDKENPSLPQPLFYHRIKGTVKGNTFTAASLSYYATRAGLLNEEVEGTTYLTLAQHTRIIKNEEGIEESVVVPNVFVAQVTSLELDLTTEAAPVITKAVEPVAEVVNVVETPIVPDSVIAEEVPTVINIATEQSVVEEPLNITADSLLAEVEADLFA